MEWRLVLLVGTGTVATDRPRIPLLSRLTHHMEAKRVEAAAEPAEQAAAEGVGEPAVVGSLAGRRLVRVCGTHQPKSALLHQFATK